MTEGSDLFLLIEQQRRVSRHPPNSCEGRGKCTEERNHVPGGKNARQSKGEDGQGEVQNSAVVGLNITAGQETKGIWNLRKTKKKGKGKRRKRGDSSYRKFFSNKTGKKEKDCNSA